MQQLVREMELPLLLLLSLLGMLACCLGSDECTASSAASYTPGDIPVEDKRLFQVALNLEYLEAEFFLWAGLGYGLDDIDPQLADGGPSPRGVQRASLDAFVRNITVQFGYQEVGHIRAIRQTLGAYAFPRPQIDLSKRTWNDIFEKALQIKLNPPFNPYDNSINFLLAAYTIPYVGLTGYVGANLNLQSPTSKRLLAGLLGIESGQDAVIRAYLYQRTAMRVFPYTFTVGEATRRLSALRGRLAEHGNGVDDEGLIVPPCLGAERIASGNVLAADSYSLSYSRTPDQVLDVVYGTGNASCPGGFFPRGGRGEIAREFISACNSCCATISKEP